eukprot:1191885-Prorocentrum_minimum.AAC.1
MAGHVPPGAFGLVNEIIAATMLGTAGLASFKVRAMGRRPLLPGSWVIGGQTANRGGASWGHRYNSAINILPFVL